MHEAKEESDEEEGQRYLGLHVTCTLSNLSMGAEECQCAEHRTFLF